MLCFAVLPELDGIFKVSTKSDAEGFLSVFICICFTPSWLLLRILLNTVVHNDYPGSSDVWLMSLLVSIEGLELKRTG